MHITLCAARVLPAAAGVQELVDTQHSHPHPPDIIRHVWQPPDIRRSTRRIIQDVDTEADCAARKRPLGCS